MIPDQGTIALRKYHIFIKIYTESHCGYNVQVKDIAQAYCYNMHTTDARLLFVGPTGTIFSEIRIKMQVPSYKKVIIKIRME